MVPGTADTEYNKDREEYLYVLCIKLNVYLEVGVERVCVRGSLTCTPSLSHLPLYQLHTLARHRRRASCTTRTPLGAGTCPRGWRKNRHRRALCVCVLVTHSQALSLSQLTLY